MLTNFHYVGRCLSLVLYGETRTGKTLWARSLGPHLYTIGMVSGDELAKAAATDIKYAIFDDMRGGFKFFHMWKEWLGAQAEVTVKQLYREPRKIKWGRPSIWVSNQDPREGLEPGDVSWLEQNCIFVEVNHPIFHANTE